MWCETKAFPGLQLGVDGAVAELIYGHCRMGGDEFRGFGIAGEVLAIEAGVMEAWSMVSAETELSRQTTYDQSAGAHV